MSIYNLNKIEQLYINSNKKHLEVRNQYQKHLTLTEKIIFSHMKEPFNTPNDKIKKNKNYINLFPDRVAMQDATAQMCLLQFINTNKMKVCVDTTIHCDHLIQAHKGSNTDLKNAMTINKEVYDFLKSVSKKYQIGFWEPGSGIIHQVILENYAFPGGLMIGTDSHTPNAGGLSMIAIGVGGTDAVDVISGAPLNIQFPNIIGVNLTGKLKGWASPKDVILKLMDILTVKGGTGNILEFYGDGCSSISTTGKATITNMGAEHGATTSLFPYDKNSYNYLKSTNRKDLAEICNKFNNILIADNEVYKNPSNFFNKIIDINLNQIDPYIAGPHSPDKITSIKKMNEFISTNKYPNKITAALIGSCTNSSYEDLSKVANLANFMLKNNIKLKTKLYITPGSSTIEQSIKDNNIIDSIIKIGGKILSNACGPCIGQWNRSDKYNNKSNSIISSYNRNFPGRNDGNKNTLSFIASPEIVMSMAITGNLSFNPIDDYILNENNIQIKLPKPLEALPNKLSINTSGYIKPTDKYKNIEIKIDNESNRLAFLKKFDAYDKNNFISLKILAKAKGKCTTDHISQAGYWLQFRGHLDKISDNTYLGMNNAFTKKIGIGINRIKNNEEYSIPEIARHYKTENIMWGVIGDENFGEGSSREHAAMQPRYLGCKIIIAKSFARIHETNLKKHGILPLTFVNVDDYNKVLYDDVISLNNIMNQLKTSSSIEVNINHNNKMQDKIICKHSFSKEQINWFKYGSALNYMSQI